MEVGAGVKDLVTGIQHLGIPVKDMGASLEFYGKLGFEEAFSTTNNGNRVVFVRQKNLVIELYEEKETAQRPGAIDHVALDVTDIEKTFELVKTLGCEMLDSSIQYLPFWDHGVRFFTILGPNKEKVEFSQMM